jgi:catechol 2,3-dioxygenase
MTEDRLIWPAQFHHVCLGTDDVPAMAEWYRDIMEMAPESAGDTVWMRGKQRDVLLRPGKKKQVHFIAFNLADARHLQRMRSYLEGRGVDCQDDASPVFEDGAYSFTDPDGNRLLFGLAKDKRAEMDPRPGHLQHIVFATTQLPVVIEFYLDVLGFKLSDVCVEEETGERTACFIRSDEMHHSMAFFRSDSARLDHFANEASCWNDIRDWGDHFADHRVEIVWGAGRHGAGNNLFIFVNDPDGNNVEISAELETFTYDQEFRTWPHDNRALNLWGHAWMRS